MSIGLVDIDVYCNDSVKTLHRTRLVKMLCVGKHVSRSMPLTAGES